MIRPASADEASDYLAAAGDETDALIACIEQYAKPVMKSPKPSDVIADEAMTACDDKVGAIRVALMGPPTLLSEDKAASETEVVRDGYRKRLIDMIEEARKGS